MSQSSSMVFRGDYEKDNPIKQYVDCCVINVMQYPFGAKGDGVTDDTAAIQSAINAINGNGIIEFPSGHTFCVTNLTFTGYLYINGNSSFLKTIATANTQAIIQADASTNNCILSIRDLHFKGDNRAIDMQHAGSGAPAIKLLAQNCRFIGITRVSDAINLRQTDFLGMRDCSFMGYDTVLRIESDLTNSERNNTQMHVENIAIIQSNLGVYLRGIAISSFVGIDIASCATGFYIYKDVNEASFINCHAEKYGMADYNAVVNGYGFHIADNMPNNDLTFTNCTAFPMGITGAITAFYQGISADLINASNVVFNECKFIFDSAVPNYQSLILKSFATWNGSFPYSDNQVTLDSNASKIVDITINVSRGTNSAISNNLLPFSRISSPEQLPYIDGTGTFAVSADTDALEYDARILAFSGVSGLYRPQYLVNLKVGWHTLIFEGYNKTSAPQLFVGMRYTPYTSLLVTSMRTTATKMRHVFYVSTAGVYKVGFQVGADCSLVCRQIELHYGFVNEFMDNNPTVCKMSAVTTAGVWSAGDRVENTAPAAGGYIGWVCTVAGVPGTWKGYGLIQA